MIHLFLAHKCILLPPMFLMRTVEGSPFRLSGLETGSQPRRLITHLLLLLLQEKLLLMVLKAVP